ncbi:alkene reductase [Spirillospora sp. CA-294931]|uniref:alkene reductase n=1 Tax=Spirillospora sp. CA-294931 TaxID=3240042 RepID=UPI003D93A95D
MKELFEPVTIGKLSLPHRLLMAPMTRSRADEERRATELMAEYYAQRAGAGLIITEGTQPSVIGQGYIQTPGLHTDEQTRAWRKVTDAVHAEGGHIFVQLMHAGRVGHPYLYPDGSLPLAPSAIASGEQLFTVDQGMLDHPTPREMSLDDIAQTVEDFASGARRAIDAGFDGVELHGANGYLIHQFLADGTNKRTDVYGGSIENRIRFAVELVRAVSDAIGPERLALRVSPGNPFNNMSESDTDELYPALMRELRQFPLAYVHVMESTSRESTRKVREAWGGTLVLNPHATAESSPSRADEALEAIRAGLADAVAFGELWLANPDLPARVKAGGPFNGADPATFYGGDHRGYTDYPALG